MRPSIRSSFSSNLRSSRAHYETASERITSYRAMSFCVRRIRTANQWLPL